MEITCLKCSDDGHVGIAVTTTAFGIVASPVLVGVAVVGAGIAAGTYLSEIDVRSENW